MHNRGGPARLASLQDPSTAVVYEAEQCTHHIEKYMAKKMQARQPPQAESSPIPADTSTPHCKHITPRELDRALKRLSSTAAGLDGVPPVILKGAGKQTKELLLEALNEVMTTATI